MGRLKWYKRDPDAALCGMFQLNLEERGAYNTVLDLIYSRTNNLPDDDRWIAGWMRVDVRVWRRLKSRLISLGKLFVEEGLLRNSRADVEVLRGLSMVGSAEDAGRASGVSRRLKSEAKSITINNMNGTTVQAEPERNPELTTTTTTTSKKKERESASRSNGQAPKRGSRLPVDWPLTSEIRAIAEAEHVNPERTHANYCDYWHAKAGAAASKMDWVATWRMWCRREAERTPYAVNGNGKLSATENLYAGFALAIGDLEHENNGGADCDPVEPLLDGGRRARGAKAPRI